MQGHLPERAASREGSSEAVGGVTESESARTTKEAGPAATGRAPVCITGMHRSGTSMVARLLGACGLDLGPPEELVPGQPDNPDGYFENQRFVSVNDEILDIFGGAWDSPPMFPPGWEDDPRLQDVRLRAGALADKLKP